MYVVVSGIILANSYMIVAVAMDLPLLRSIPTTTIALAFHVLLGWCYVAACATDAGRVPLDWDPTSVTSGLSNALRVAYQHAKDTGNRSYWCRKCDRPKPARCHHCSVCGTCVLKMDHHCPWYAKIVEHAGDSIHIP